MKTYPTFKELIETSVHSNMSQRDYIYVCNAIVNGQQSPRSVYVCVVILNKRFRYLHGLFSHVEIIYANSIIHHTGSGYYPIKSK